MMATEESIRKVDGFWAAYFGCKPEDLNAKRTLVVSHAALRGYDGALVFRHGEACVVSVPETTPEIEREKLKKGRPDEVFDPKFLSKAFVVGTDKVTGPAWVAVADRSDFRPVKGSGIKELGPEDEQALAGLAEASGQIAWKQSKLMLDLKPMFVQFEGKEIVAASGYRSMSDTLAYIGVVTHPGHRGKGYAKAVASASMEHAISKGLIPLWRTLRSNESAIALSKLLGFQPYAQTYDVALTEDEF